MTQSVSGSAGRVRTARRRLPRPTGIARLRLVFGYLSIVLAFFVNADNLSALPGETGVADTLRQVFYWWALVVVALGAFIRMWSAGFLLKTEELATEGPYALSRNPLYLGSFLAGVGLCAFVHNLWLLLFFAATFAFTYGPQIRWEEQLLSREHGEDFRRYMRAVPRFFPVKWNAAALRGCFSLDRLVENKELPYQIFWIVMTFSLIGQAYLRAEGISISFP